MAEIVSKAVVYRDGATELEGWIAFDSANPPKSGRPGILVIHDWTGLGGFVKEKTEALARLGYVAFGADIYGKGIRPSNPKDAGAESGKYKNDRALLRRRVNLGLDQLRVAAGVDRSRLAAIGFCFGGTSVLELARSGTPTAGVVSFHGGLDSPTPADARNIKGKILVLHGADDPYVPATEVKAFEEEMRSAKVDWQMISYGGAVHSFTNKAAGNDNAKGAAYNAAADTRSWGHMRQFFDEVFRVAAE